MSSATNGWPEGEAFNAELFALNKPSSSKINSIADHALSLSKHYKQVVYTIERYIRKSSRDTRLFGLYVIDALIRKSRQHFGERKDPFASRLANNMLLTFAKALEIRREDFGRVAKILKSWKSNHFFPKELLEEMDALYASQAASMDGDADYDRDNGEKDGSESPIAPVGDESPDRLDIPTPVATHTSSHSRQPPTPQSSSKPSRPHASSQPARDPRRAAAAAAAASQPSTPSSRSFPPPPPPPPSSSSTSASATGALANLQSMLSPSHAAAPPTSVSSSSQSTAFPFPPAQPPAAFPPPPPPPPVAAPAPVPEPAAPAADMGWEYSDEEEEEEDEEARKEKVRKKLEEEKERMAAAQAAPPTPRSAPVPLPNAFPQPPSPSQFQQQPPGFPSPYPQAQPPHTAGHGPTPPPPTTTTMGYPGPETPQTPTQTPARRSRFSAPKPKEEVEAGMAAEMASLPHGSPALQSTPSTSPSYERHPSSARDVSPLSRERRRSRSRSREREREQEYDRYQRESDRGGREREREWDRGGNARHRDRSSTTGAPATSSSGAREKSNREMPGFVVLPPPYQERSAIAADVVQVLSSTLAVSHPALNVMGVDFHTLRATLMDRFSSFGLIDSINARDRLSFIKFRTRRSAAQAKQNFDGGHLPLNLHGHPATIIWGRAKDMDKERFDANSGEGVVPRQASAVLNMAPTEEPDPEIDEGWRNSRRGGGGGGGGDGNGGRTTNSGQWQGHQPSQHHSPSSVPAGAAGNWPQSNGMGMPPSGPAYPGAGGSFPPPPPPPPPTGAGPFPFPPGQGGMPMSMQGNMAGMPPPPKPGMPHINPQRTWLLPQGQKDTRP